MSDTPRKDRGTALFLVLAIVFVVVALANIMLSFMHSQSRLTHHEVSRIQAYYAAQAAMNYALEKLRTGGWSAGQSYTSITGAANYNAALHDIVAGFHPTSINSINVTIDVSAGSIVSGTSPVNITVDYQYAPTL